MDNEQLLAAGLSKHYVKRDYKAERDNALDAMHRLYLSMQENIDHLERRVPLVDAVIEAADLVNDLLNLEEGEIETDALWKEYTVALSSALAALREHENGQL